MMNDGGFELREQTCAVGGLRRGGSHEITHLQGKNTATTRIKVSRWSDQVNSADSFGDAPVSSSGALSQEQRCLGRR